MSTINLAPLCDHRISVALALNVPNTKRLFAYAKGDITQIVPRPHVFLNAEMVIGMNCIVAAVSRALLNERDGKLKTKMLTSEIIHSISLTNKITESFKLYGISERTRHVLTIIVNPVDDDVSVMQKFVEGTYAPIDSLDSLADRAAIEKLGKLSVSELGALESSVCTRIAVKNL